MTPSTGSAPPVLRAWRRIPGPPRDRVKARLLRLYRALGHRFGPQGSRPGRTPYEVAVGAILTRQTAWTNAAHAVAALRRRRLLSASVIDRMPEADVADVIRAAGTFRLKARRLKAFTRWLCEGHGGRFDGMRRAPLASLRRELLGVPGLGPETVDAILLYAAGRPVFVADASARRALARHRLVSAHAGYEAAREFVQGHLPSDPALFNEFHGLLVELGKRHCRTAPDCQHCPLRFDLETKLPAARIRSPGRGKHRATLSRRHLSKANRVRPRSGYPGNR